MWALHDSLQQTNAGHIDGSSTNNADDLQNLAGNVSGSPGDFDPNDDDDLELQFQETSSGTNRIRSTEIDGTRFRFNTGHGFDRVHTNQATGVTTDLRTTNLTPNQIESAIAQDAFNYSSNGGNIPRVGTGFQGPLVRSITINDFNIEYRVVQLADESINISTYYLLP
jgi:hypothetical protein